MARWSPFFQASVVGGERKVVMRGQTTANAIGEFRIANLQHGNYYLSATGSALVFLFVNCARNHAGVIGTGDKEISHRTKKHRSNAAGGN